METRRLRDLDNALLKDATFAARSFPPHFHDTVSLAIVTAGTELLRVGGTERDVAVGDIAVLPARTVHSHRSTSTWQYKVLYLSPDLLARCARRTGALPPIAAEVIRDRELHARLVAVHARADERAWVRGAVISIVDHLLGRRRARAAPPDEDAPRRQAAMDEVAAILRARSAAKLTIGALASRFGLSTYQLVRAFRARHGLTPAAYLMTTRINAAQRLLGDGARVADVAVAVGFFDQSHLVRHFTRHVGVAPVRYRAGNQRAGR